MLPYDSLTRRAGLVCALILASSCNQILGNPAPGTNDGGSGGMGGGGAPADSGGSSSAGAATGGSSGGGGNSGGSGGAMECGSGTFDHDSNPDTACESWSKCQPGQYVSESGTHTSDRSCKACSAGTFSDTQNAAECAEWIDCEPGEYVASAGTKEDDRQCEPCADGEYSTGENSPQCSLAKDCGHPWKYVKEATPTSDAECGSAVRQFGSPEGESDARVAIDAAGNVYVAGATGGALASDNVGYGDAYVRKYDTKGTLNWEGQFGSNGNEWVWDVAVDGAGNVYIAGATEGSLPGGTATDGAYDAYVVKYSADGVRQFTWQFRAIDDNGYNIASSVAVDGSGNVYVAGTTTGGPTAKGNFLRKYDSSGAEVWTFTDTADQMAPVNWSYPHVAVDEDGTAYLAWYRNFSWVTLNALTKFPTDSNGTAEWTMNLNSVDEDLFAEPLGVAVASDGIYIVGFTTGGIATANRGGDDAYVVKYDVAGGGTLWWDQLGGTGDERATDVAVDAAGAVFVVGVTASDLAGPNTGDTDCFLRKYSGSGVVRWTKQWGTPSGDTAAGVVVDGHGNAFVAGSTTGSLAAENPSGWGDFYVMLAEPP